MKIFVTIYQMQEGGAARVTTAMINGLADKGYDIVLCTDTSYYSVFYPVSEEIKIISYNPKPIKQNKYIHMTKAIFQMRKLIKEEKPDVVIGVESIFYFLTNIACKGLHVPIIAVDHTSMGRNQGRFINWIRHKYYGTSAALSILTHKDEALLGDSIPQKRVIHNPLSFAPLNSPTLRGKTVLCVGRLNVWKVKGFDLMLDVWQKVAPSHPDWILKIAGDGTTDSINEIEEMISQRGLEGKVRLLGQVSSICSLYQKTSIFALSSRVEGFPMGLIEAMSQGCACIAFSMQGAVNEIFGKSQSGIIIKDGAVDSFATELSKLISASEEQRSELGQRAIERSKDFSEEAFVAKWIKLIHDVTK
ncbi:glycosyl transferase family protein [Bacteroides thetaiotaomicron]|jgi:GalNAc-alpha-(1->4)-GalNAc-alpha-(1->3)-diNAcBac-PP-undecaprenol alpha-1,4-N-acetyl-D-galactosaminyltransferase|uniref:glycosyltransferase n=1 Tax=Bacteroides thetaiotaomicron TaxID=818 RepID=UPI0006C51ECD|nr:glycosyltransferase [Bacteroides thetaiotaomicron]MCA5996624.1 glycosyltransferase [Bacteroides thetaiotaomicron]MCS3042529.1 glycosyltransferase [Bacteroides thetaiotaomicron]CUN26908.1 glycosyl transferase family protein [Bacteroides thetaiotaomicron]